MTLTVTELREKWRGQQKWKSDGGSRGAGRLTARLTGDGWLLYYQYFHDGEKHSLPLGPHDEAGRRGLTLVLARDRAAELAALYRSGVTDLHEHLKREREAAERAHRAADEAQRRAQEDAQRSTLKQLLDAYVGHLKRLGKESASDAEGLFRRHILEPAIDLGATKAAEVPADEYVRLISKVVEAGKGRAAGKLRSYLRAAYQLAIRARTDPAASTLLRSFGITANPIASIGALSQYNRARDRVLSAPELFAYTKRLEALPDGATKDALQLSLLLGGQRPTQLLRARPADLDLSSGTLTLYDPKGARRQPRRHVVPINGEAAAILKRRLNAISNGSPFFSIDGQTGLRPETVPTHQYRSQVSTHCWRAWCAAAVWCCRISTWSSSMRHICPSRSAANSSLICGRTRCVLD